MLHYWYVTRHRRCIIQFGLDVYSAFTFHHSTPAWKQTLPLQPQYEYYAVLHKIENILYGANISGGQVVIVVSNYS